MTKRKDIRKDVLSFWVPTAEGGLRPSGFQCSGSAKPPLRQGFHLRWKRLYGALAPPARRPGGCSSVRLQRIWKYSDCSDFSKKKHLLCRCFFFGYLGPFKLLGRSEFALRRGFACGKTLERRKSGAAQTGRWVIFKIADENLMYLYCHTLLKRNTSRYEVNPKS